MSLGEALVELGQSSSPKHSGSELLAPPPPLSARWHSHPRPAHVGSGLLQGMGDICSGVAKGAAGIIAAPVCGAHQEGTLGFFKGMGAGIAGAVVYPVAGVVYGAFSVGSGVLNTKTAIQEARKGRIYDRQSERWVERARVLDEEFLEKTQVIKNLPHSVSMPELVGHNSSCMVGGDAHNVRDRTYYDLLGVEPGVDMTELRKAYYRTARHCHPDRNPNDSEAHLKFQKLSEAYQVLSDPDRRARYDAHGIQEDDDEDDFVEPEALFAYLFGTDELEPFIGQLRMRYEIQLSEIKNYAVYQEAKVAAQDYREVMLAVALRKRLEPLVQALNKNVDIDVCEASLTKEAELLCKASYGGPIVEAIGFAYANRAEHWLSKKGCPFFGGAHASMKLRKRRFNLAMAAARSNCHATRAARDGSQTSSSANKKQPEKLYIPSDSSSTTASSSFGVMQAIEYMRNAYLAIAIEDIVVTLERMCKKYLDDLGCSSDEQILRAKALAINGRIFTEVSESYGPFVDYHYSSSDDLERELEEAYAKIKETR